METATESSLQIPRLVLLTIWSAAAFISMPTQLTGQITVGRTAQVSQSMDHAAHTEATISAHPTNPAQIAVCSMLVESQPNRLTSALYLSHDAGSSWQLAVHDSVGRRGEAWDPTCAFAPTRTVLFATLPSQGDRRQPDFRRFTRVHRSDNLGASWAEPIATTYLDNEDLAVDWTGGPYHGRVYLVGILTNRSVPGRRYLAVAYSTDGGQTFQTVERYPEPGTFQGHGGAPVVAPDGDLIVPITVYYGASSDSTEAPPPVVAIVRVTDGGAEISAPAAVAPYESCGEAGPPVVAVDNSTGPFRGRIYAAFPDGSGGRCQIQMSWSDDGVSWSTPIPVDDPAIPLEPRVGPDVFLPAIAVNQHGVVGITWYDRREDPRNRDFRLRFTASADGGHSVMRSVPVSDQPYHYALESETEALVPSGMVWDPDSTGTGWVIVHTGSSNRLYYEIGDYTGFTARPDGVFQAMWIDNRSGVPQLFTSGITVGATARTPADRDRELGRVVSDSVPAEVVGVSFEPETCRVQVRVEFLNRAERPVQLPLKVLIVEAISQLGAPVPDGTPMDDHGRAIWSIGDAGTLEPGGSIDHTGSFQLQYCRPLAGRGDNEYGTKLDSRLRNNAPASVTGPKILAIRFRVFEPESPINP